jgi:CRP/FNR family transcriptional regulator, cyclic AMP receptor protein
LRALDPRETEDSMDAKTTLLGRVPLFAHLGGRSLERVASLVDEVDVAAGTELTREGALAGEFFIISDGSVEIRRAGAIVRSLGPGDFLGEIALIDGGRRSATATTTSPCHLLVLARREFNTLIDDYVDVRLSVLQALAERVRSLDAQAT